MSKKKKQRINSAVEFLNATKSESGWVYCADETRAHYLALDNELELLGKYLEQTCGATAYSWWCDATPTRPAPNN